MKDKKENKIKKIKILNDYETMKMGEKERNGK